MMKKIRIGGLVMAAVVAASLTTGCQKDGVVLKAEFAPFAGDGKVYIDNTNTPRWEDGDTINVNGEACIVSDNTLTAESSLSGYNAVYPASIFQSMTGSQVNVTLPRKQIYSTTSSGQVVKAPMCAHSDNTTLLFHNPGALLAIQTTNSTGRNLTIDSIVVKSDAVALWGPATIDDITAAQPQLTTGAFSDGVNDSVVLKGSGDASMGVTPGTTCYVYLPAAASSTGSHLTISIYCHANDGVRYYSKTQTTANAGDIPAGSMASVPSVIASGNEHVIRVTGVFHISSLHSSQSVCFAPSNLKKTSNGYEFMSNQYDYVSDVGTDVVGSTYFSWNALNTHGFGMYDSPVSWGSLGNWFVLVESQWEYVMGVTSGRAGTTVNGHSGSLFVKASVNSVNGVILFPDNVASIAWPTDATAPTASNINSTSAGFTSATLTAAQWTTLENQGCVFLPAAGSCSAGGSSPFSVTSFVGQNIGGNYWTASGMGILDYDGYVFIFGQNDIAFTNLPGTWGFSVRLVKAFS